MFSSPIYKPIIQRITTTKFKDQQERNETLANTYIESYISHTIDRPNSSFQRNLDNYKIQLKKEAATQLENFLLDIKRDMKNCVLELQADFKKLSDQQKVDMETLKNEYETELKCTANENKKKLQNDLETYIQDCTSKITMVRLRQHLWTRVRDAT